MLRELTAYVASCDTPGCPESSAPVLHLADLTDTDWIVLCAAAAFCRDHAPAHDERADDPDGERAAEHHRPDHRPAVATTDSRTR